MNINQYVNKIAAKIKCSKSKKREIKKELLSDIQCRIEQGERFEDIVSQMGSIKEIADTFNENLSKKEKRIYTGKKALLVMVIAAALIAGLFLIGYWNIPRTADIDNSEYFDKEQVENTVKQTVDLLDTDDYDTLRENADKKMKKILNKETMDTVKKAISEDWGDREKFGTVYMAEIVQGNKHYVVTEIMVVYENVSVVYRLTYDQDMKLAGVYVR